MATIKLKPLLLIFGALSLGLGATNARSAPAVETPSNLEINLGAKLEVSLPPSLNLSQPAKLVVDPGELADEIREGDLSIQIDPSSRHIEIVTQTFAPALHQKKFAILQEDPSGSLIDRAEMSLTIEPVYVVDVIDGPNGGNDPDNPFDFSSQPGMTYFRPQTAGLQIIFTNKSSKPIIIHGSGGIQHQPMVPIQPGQSYVPPAVFPSAPANLPGYYTIHGVYHPGRDVTFNATSIPEQPSAQ